MTRTSIGVLQVVLLLLGAPLLAGTIRKVRARLEGRRGAPVVQPLFDTWKLFGKQRMLPQGSSWLFKLAPLVVLGTALVVGAVGPFVTTTSPVPQAGDLFVVVSLVLLGTVALAAAGLDTGTAFGGMGASREMTVAALAEPTLLVATFALAVPAGSTNLQTIVTQTLRHPGGVVAAATVLAFVALALAMLAEGGRLPVDNPSTHLELTMIHEAMVLEYSGADLAMIELGAAARLTLFLALLANLFVPWGVATSGDAGALAVGTAVLAGKVLFLGVLLGVFEVFTAKLRLFRVPELLALSLVLAFLSVTAAFFLA